MSRSLFPVIDHETGMPHLPPRAKKAGASPKKASPKKPSPKKESPKKSPKKPSPKKPSPKKEEEKHHHHHHHHHHQLAFHRLVHESLAKRIEAVLEQKNKSEMPIIMIPARSGLTNDLTDIIEGIPETIKYHFDGTTWKRVNPGLPDDQIVIHKVKIGDGKQLVFVDYVPKEDENARRRELLKQLAIAADGGVRWSIRGPIISDDATIQKAAPVFYVRDPSITALNQKDGLERYHELIKLRQLQEAIGSGEDYDARRPLRISGIDGASSSARNFGDFSNYRPRANLAKLGGSK